MTGSAGLEEPGQDRPAMRADAVESRERILAAAETLGSERRITMMELAAAAGVGRSTLYRHFPNRRALREALEDRPSQRAHPVPSGRVAPLPFRAPGRLGSEARLPLEVTHVLDEVPPHLIPDQLVAEARRAAGVPVALYVVDIDGSQLIRLAGTEDFPATLDGPPALGPEIVPEGLPRFQERLRAALPGCMVEPLWLRGRVTGLLLCIGAPVDDLADIAKQGAAALELANDYTDMIEAARRRKRPTPAAEIQQDLLPPRIVRITGAQVAGGLLPTYEVGGDWFDLVENRDGAWLAIGDAAGNGPTAAGLGAAALGALRASRRSGCDLPAAVTAVDETVRRHQNPDLYVTGLIGRWSAATTTFSWISCGHPHSFLADLDGNVERLEGPDHAPLGTGPAARSYPISERRLSPGDRLILVTDGVTDRRTEDGTFGIHGIRRTVSALTSQTAAATTMALLQALVDCWLEPLEDDGTVVVLSVN